MGRKIDMIGQQFGRLLVLEDTGRDKYRRVLWKCLCDCGVEKTVCGCHLRSGNTKSCGCFQKEKTSEIGRKNKGENHGMFNKKHSNEACKKISSAMKGENHPNYNPNLTDEERQTRREYPDYKEWRVAVFERDNYICQCCGTKKGPFNAHHLESYRDNPELRTLLENGITLCENCHKNFHHLFGYGDNTRKQFEQVLICGKFITVGY